MRTPTNLPGALVLNVFSIVNLVASSPLVSRGPSCQNMTIPVTIAADVVSLPSDFTLNAETIESLLSLVSTLVFDIPVQGTFHISASYCEPEVHIPSRVDTLQLLVHGATYTRNYWSGDGAPGFGYDGDKYSWVAYASKQGYPTLAIDRLGNGLSDHPDPLLVAQVPAQVEVSHAIVQLARTGTAPFPRAFSKVIYVGHSFGSMIGNGLNVKYPNDVDATVLTGFSENLITSFASTFAGVGILPASIANPAKYGDLNPCYLQTVIKADVTKVFFYPGGYDIALTDYDWTVRGTLSCGEAVTGVISIGTASEYNHPVYVINGQYDEIFCNVLPPLTSADCGYGSSSILAKTKTIYPAASVYGWSGIPDSGHCWQLHYAAQDGFNQTHIWLSSVGF